MVNFGFGADVDAARGLVDQEHVAIAREPFGEGDFLLVAAAQASGECFERWCFDAQALGVLGCKRALGLAAHETQARQQRQRGERGVFAAIQTEDEPLAFTVFGYEAESGGEGVLDGAERERLVVDPNVPANRGIEAEDGLD